MASLLTTREQTYIMIKPDGVQRGLVGKIIARFEEKGFKLVGLKLMTPSKEHLEKHYADLSCKKLNIFLKRKFIQILIHFYKTWWKII